MLETEEHISVGDIGAHPLPHMLGDKGADALACPTAVGRGRRRGGEEAPRYTATVTESHPSCYRDREPIRRVRVRERVCERERETCLAIATASFW